MFHELNFATSLQMDTNWRGHIRIHSRPWPQNLCSEIRQIRVIRSFFHCYSRF